MRTWDARGREKGTQMSTLCTVCNQYPCPGCLGAAQDEIGRLRRLLVEFEARLERDREKMYQAISERTNMQARLDECLRAEFPNHDLLPGCGGPYRLDAPGGPVCSCGQPSRHESGWCGRTAK